MKNKIKFRLNGWRGVCLLIGAFFAFTRGFAYIPGLKAVGNQLGTQVPFGLQILDSVVPLSIWSVAWFIVTILCLVYAFKAKDQLAWGALEGMWLMWGLAYVGGWLLNAAPDGEVNREWLNAVTYLAPAAIIAITSSHIPTNWTLTRGEIPNDNHNHGS